MKYILILFLIIINFNVYSQSNKLLVTLDPMNCGNCIRNVNNLIKKISKDIPIYWLIRESYSGQIKKLEQQLQIEIGKNVIASDSLFSILSKKGSVLTLYKKDSLIFSLPINKMNAEYVEIINSMVDKTSDINIFQFPDSLMFSKMVTLKTQKNEYLFVDNLYNELTLLKNSQFKQVKGKSFLTRNIYFNAFKDNSYFDSINIHLSESEKVVKFMNVSFGDSTIELLCNLPLIKPFENKIGIYYSPAIISLDKNLKFISIISLNNYFEKKSGKTKYYLVPDLFEYYNHKFYFSYVPDFRGKMNKEVYFFASLTNNQMSERPSMNFLDIKFSRDWATTLYSFVNRYFYFNLPSIYNSFLPFEFNLENSTSTNYGINGFSYKELEASTKGQFSYSDLFHISTIYRTDNFFVALYRKNGKSIKEIYDIAGHKSIYHHQYDYELINFKDGICTFYAPTGMNKFVFLDGKNRVKEVTF